jgi:hypothetical protein
MTTFGTSGIDFTNHRLNGAATYFDQPDPSLLPYGHFEAVSTGGDGGQNAYRFVPNDNSRITDQGYIRGQDGGNYTQLQPDGNYNFSDPNAIINDPEFGSLTRVENIKQPHDMWSTWLPVAVASLLGGPVAYAAAGAGAGAGGGLLGGAGSDTAAMGAFDQFGSTGLGDVFAGAPAAGGAGIGAGVGADTAPMGAFDQFGSSGMGDVFGGGAPVTDLSTAAGGAPVTDLSVHAGLGDTLNNLIPGGLLSGGSGLSTLLRVAGLGTSLSGLLGHGNTSTNNNNTNNDNNPPGSKGGGGQGLNITRGQYTPNPYTQQQLQNFQFAQPRGR